MLLDIFTDRQITTVERLDNERLVAEMNNAAYTVTRVKRSTRTRIIPHRTVIITMLDLLKQDSPIIDIILSVFYISVFLLG